MYYIKLIVCWWECVKFKTVKACYDKDCRKCSEIMLCYLFLPKRESSHSMTLQPDICLLVVLGKHVYIFIPCCFYKFGMSLKFFIHPFHFCRQIGPILWLLYNFIIALMVFRFNLFLLENLQYHQLWGKYI